MVDKNKKYHEIDSFSPEAAAEHFNNACSFNCDSCEAAEGCTEEFHRLQNIKDEQQVLKEAKKPTTWTICFFDDKGHSRTGYLTATSEQQAREKFIEYVPANYTIERVMKGYLSFDAEMITKNFDRDYDDIWDEEDEEQEKALTEDINIDSPDYQTAEEIVSDSFVGWEDADRDFDDFGRKVARIVKYLHSTEKKCIGVMVDDEDYDLIPSANFFVKIGEAVGGVKIGQPADAFQIEDGLVVIEEPIGWAYRLWFKNEDQAKRYFTLIQFKMNQ